MKFSSYLVLFGVFCLFLVLQGFFIARTYFYPVTLTSVHASIMRTDLDIGTPAGGTVKNVRTYENQQVEAGVILFEILAQSTEDPLGSTLMHIRAPRAGIIVGVSVEPGEFVQAGAVLARVIDTDPHAQFIEATFKVEPNDRAKLQRFEHAIAQADHFNNGKPVQALVTSVSPIYDSEKQTVGMRLRLQEGFSTSDTFTVGLPIHVTLQVENTNSFKTWFQTAIQKFAPESFAERL